MDLSNSDLLKFIDSSNGANLFDNIQAYEVLEVGENNREALAGKLGTLPKGQEVKIYISPVNIKDVLTKDLANLFFATPEKIIGSSPVKELLSKHKNEAIIEDPEGEFVTFESWASERSFQELDPADFLKLHQFALKALKIGENVNIAEETEKEDQRLEQTPTAAAVEIPINVSTKSVKTSTAAKTEVISRLFSSAIELNAVRNAKEKEKERNDLEKLDRRKEIEETRGLAHESQGREGVPLNKILGSEGHVEKIQEREHLEG